MCLRKPLVQALGSPEVCIIANGIGDTTVFRRYFHMKMDLRYMLHINTVAIVRSSAGDCGSSSSQKTFSACLSIDIVYVKFFSTPPFFNYVPKL